MRQDPKLTIHNKKNEIIAETFSLIILIWFYLLICQFDKNVLR